MKFTTVAFDLDGTLYPSYRLNIFLVPFALKELRLLRALGKARSRLRKYGGYNGNYYETQARLMGEILNEPAERVMERTERLIYRGWEPYFKKIRLFPHVRETLDAFRKEGIKMGLLSDFPPEKKLENLQISEYWDVVLCSETVGRLKPDSEPFLELARRMEAPPEQILYVGNSFPYDVKGAGMTGMKTALVRPKWNRWLPRIKVSGGGAAPNGNADIVFYDYRQLRDYVLG